MKRVYELFAAPLVFWSYWVIAPVAWLSVAAYPDSLALLITAEGASAALAFSLWSRYRVRHRPKP